MFARMMRFLAASNPAATDLGFLLLRLVFGGMLCLGHGLGKLQNFPAGADKFPDPLGVGHTFSMGAAIFGEVFCAAAVAVGLLTRLAALQVAFTMGVAVIMAHAGAPLFMPATGAREPAMIYLTAFLVILFAGPGRFSIDALFVQWSTQMQESKRL